MRYNVLRHPGRLLVATAALTSLLLPGQAALADDGVGEALVPVVANADSDCVGAGDELAEQLDVPSDAEVFYGCVDGVVTVNAFDEAYAPVIDPASDRYAEPFAEDAGTPPGDLAQAKVGGGGADCDIVTKYKSECYFPITYVYVKSGKVQWKRTIDVYTKTQLQQASHEVFLRYTNKHSKSMKVRGNIILQRQQGALPPTFESSTDFSFGTATQVQGTKYVTRTTTDTGKYSIIFNAMYVKESSVPVEIAILGDPTGPRFQCYAKSQKKNCEWPNGKEVGVF